MTNSNEQSNVGYQNSMIAAGGSGFSAGYAGFFFEGIKKRLQSNQSIPNPMKLGINVWARESFRGAGSFAVSCIPASMLQQMASHYFEKQNTSNTYLGKIGEAVFSGALGGIPSAAIGNVLLKQQMGGIGPKEALSELLPQGVSRVFRGTLPLMVKESIFGLCYLKVMDDAADYASKHFGESYVIPAQVTVGILGSLASHPFDTMATVMQQFNSNALDASKRLWQEGGIKSFYKGGAARIGLFSSTMVVINKTKAAILEQLDDDVATPQM